MASDIRAEIEANIRRAQRLALKARTDASVMEHPEMTEVATELADDLEAFADRYRKRLDELLGARGADRRSSA